MKKTNIPTDLGIMSHKDLTGLAATMSGSYRLDGTTDAWVNFTGPFTEDDQAGTYLVKHAFTAAGIYALRFSSTDPRIGTHYAKVEVGDASIDDVKNAIDAAQIDITSIKNSVSAMDAAVLDSIATQTNEIDATLAALNTTINDTTANNGVNSLRELLVELQTAGTGRDSLITALGNVLKANTDDLEAMIRGDQFLSDGVTANPFFGKSGHETYDLIVAEVQNIKDLVTTSKTQLDAAITAAKTSIETNVAAVKTVVDGNAVILGDATFGNAAIKNAIDALSTNSGSGTQGVVDLLNDATNGLAAIKTAVMDKLTVMSNTQDTMHSKVDELVSRTEVAVIA